MLNLVSYTDHITISQVIFLLLLSKRLSVFFDGGCPPCAPAIQPELKIGQPDDKYERETDRIAEEVMRMPELAMQRKPT